MSPLKDAAHLCIDMQRIFSKGGVWETPWMERVLPVVVEIAERYKERTIFTRYSAAPDSTTMEKALNAAL